MTDAIALAKKAKSRGWGLVVAPETAGGLGADASAAQYAVGVRAGQSEAGRQTGPDRGAQQPGMTGQVKDELLTRWAELGLTISQGSIRFSPAPVGPAGSPGSRCCSQILFQNRSHRIRSVCRF